MYILTQHITDIEPRACRLADDDDIWLQLAPGQNLAMTPAEAQALVAELTRELAAVEAEARSAAA